MNDYQTKLRTEIDLILKNIAISKPDQNYTLTLTDYTTTKQSEFPNLSENELYANLKEVIYRQLYKRRDLPKDNTWPLKGEADFKLFIEKTLSALHTELCGKEQWETEFMSTNSGSLMVQRRNYEKKHIFAGHYNTDSLDYPLKANDPVTVSWFKASRFRIDKHFFYLHGQYIPDDYDGAVNQVRFYLNFIANDDFKALFPQFIRELLVAFNLKKIPFQIKVLTTLFSKKIYEYAVSDTAVIYLENRYFATSEGIILSIAKQSKYNSIMAKHVPMFVRELAEGVGFAENPWNSPNSFGQDRSFFLADTLIKLFKEVTKMPETASVLRKINEGYPNGFYLNPIIEKSTDRRRATRASKPYPYVFSTSSNNAPPTPLSNDLTLNVAQQIGYIICKEAIWDHKGRCNWVVSTEETVHKTLDVTVLSGTSGVALFLGALSIYTNDPAYRMTAEGVLQHIKSNLSTLIKANQWSFYDGVSGAMYTLLKVSSQLGKPDLFMSDIASILKNDLRPFQMTANLLKEEFTILSGLAGKVMGMIKLLRYLPDDLKPAIREIIDADSTTLSQIDSNLFFDDSNFLKTAGYARGLSGIGLTLIEVGNLFGKKAFVEKGEEFLNKEQVAEIDSFSAGWRGEISESAFFLALNRQHTFLRLSESAQKLLSKQLEQMKGQDKPFYKIFNIESGLGLLELYLEVRKNFSALVQTTLGTKYEGTFLRDIKSSFDTDTHKLNEDSQFNVNMLRGLAGIGYGVLRLHDANTVEPILILHP